MIFERAIECWGTDEFSEVFSEELSEQFRKLNLERLCQSGGYPDCESIGSVKATETEDGLEVVVRVSFDEEIGTGCGDITHTEPHLAELTIMIDLDDGDAYVVHIEDWCRDPDPD